MLTRGVMLRRTAQLAGYPMQRSLRSGPQLPAPQLHGMSMQGMSAGPDGLPWPHSISPMPFAPLPAPERSSDWRVRPDEKLLCHSLLSHPSCSAVGLSFVVSSVRLLALQRAAAVHAHQCCSASGTCRLYYGEKASHLATQ